MSGPTKAKAGWRAGCSQDAGTRESGSDSKHTPTLHAWRWLARIGVTVAAWALDRYALATDTPAPGTVEAADMIEAAAQYLAPDSELSEPLKRAREADA